MFSPSAVEGTFVVIKRLEFTPNAKFIAKEQSESQWVEDPQEVKDKSGRGDLLLLGRWWKEQGQTLEVGGS